MSAVRHIISRTLADKDGGGNEVIGNGVRAFNHAVPGVIAGCPVERRTNEIAAGER